MQQDNASFWADIKYYEERLSQTPDSYLFARLAEVYLKVGLVDDALHTARMGVARHPGYISGLRVLAQATSAKGLHDECCETLEKVIKAQPEDAESQMMLGRLLVVNGNTAAAMRAFRTVLEFNPENVEARLELEAVERTSAPQVALASQNDSVESSVADSVGTWSDAGVAANGEAAEEEDIYELDDGDLIVEEVEAEIIEFEPPAPAVVHHDPLSTMTLAELYEKQGFVDKALEIYRAILSDDPTNADVQSRIANLMLEESAASPVPLQTPETEDVTFNMDFQEMPLAAAGLPENGSADNIVATLEGWLENVRRIKACR